MRNFSSACALFAGLTSPSISCLKRTAALDKPSKKIHTAMDKLMSLENNSQAYRKALESSRPSAVPWLCESLNDI